jgi:AcrR family transcriptional regulator
MQPNEPLTLHYRAGVTYRAGIETRERILNATRRLLAEGGLETTTVKAICDLAEIRPGSFYNLFPSKEEVVLTVVREAIEAVDPGGPDASETVSDLVQAYVRFITSEPVIARVYLIVAVTGGLTDRTIGKRVLRHHQYRVERFRQAILRDAGGSPPRAEERAEQLVATLTGFAMHAVLNPDFDLPKQAERMLEH